jgi:carbonic anhydrase
MLSAALIHPPPAAAQVKYQPMKKVCHSEAPRERYSSDAAVLACFDVRFDPGFQKFLESLGVLRPDSIRVAGGAKCLASPANESERQFVLDQIRTSIRLHQTRRVLLMVHSDCGAYGGLAEAFHGDVAAESAHHRQELQRAADCLAQAIPGLEIQAYFADFEGVWDAELRSSSPQAVA